MASLDPVEQNILGVQQLVGSKLNKGSSGVTDNVEGVEGSYEDELGIDLDDDKLLKLADTWTLNYAPYESKIKSRQEANKTFYLGRQREGGSQATTEGQPISANLLFEAEETFLPAALSKNPEPVVWSDNSPEGTKIANDVKTMLQYHASTLAIRRKITIMTRHWSIYFIGVMKFGWDSVIQDIKIENRNPQNFIFDPEGFIDAFGDYEGPLGERITVPASVLINLFPAHRDFITVLVNGKLGTKVTYTEWWNDDYTFVTFKGRILSKNKNPFYNHDQQTIETDLDGNQVPNIQKGRNHFGKPKKPYIFLSVFSLGDQPHDITGLIEQNIPNQRRITRRTDQIDYNLSRANNSDVFSENNFNQETAKQAARGMALGHPILVPQGGPIAEAIHRLQAPTIDGSFFKELETSKEDLRSIFGTEGITSEPGKDDATARGMILNQQFDSSRIGGGIGDAIEQVASGAFNWLAQLYYVFYDEPHYATVMGQMKAVEFITLSAMDLDRRLVISVMPDSMKPHDEITEMNQAMALWEAKALDPKTLLTRLNFPDPQTTAEQTVLWLTNPQAYVQLNFPQLAQDLQVIAAQQAAIQQQAQGGGAPQPGSPQPGQPVQPEQPGSTAGGAIDANSSLSQVPLPK